MLFKDTYLDLTVPKVMGILNVTPDSFSDGGHFNEHDQALRQADRMLQEGADFIDIGGESTRPGAKDVSEQQELDRVIPIIESINQRFDTVVSIDTSKAVVMSEAVKAGAGLINDVRALREPGALVAASACNVPVCLMHMQGQPRTMQYSPSYENVCEDVVGFLQARIEDCISQGIRADQILIDPGFGFGKSQQHNYELLADLKKLAVLSVPILVGISRKSMLGNLLKRDVSERLAGSIAAATISMLKGACIIRVHDVKESVDAAKVVAALIKG